MSANESPKELLAQARAIYYSMCHGQITCEEAKILKNRWKPNSLIVKAIKN